MCEGNHSMAEIASKVGFLNQSYFTASFKKKYNMTPTQYIKQLKNETNKSDKKTHLRLLQNARTFETKRKYISSETPLRFNPNVKAFFTRKKSSKK